MKNHSSITEYPNDHNRQLKELMAKLTNDQQANWLARAPSTANHSTSHENYNRLVADTREPSSFVLMSKA